MARKFGIFTRRAMGEKYKNGASTLEIAAEYDCTPQLVQRYLEELQIARRSSYDHKVNGKETL